MKAFLHQSFCFLVGLMFVTTAGAATIEGIVLTDSGPAEGAKVVAYRTFADLTAKANAVVSVEGGKPGQYRIDLDPGKYYLTASSQRQGQSFFAYHGLNPITIADAYQWIPFFVLPETKLNCEVGYQGIGGRVLYKETPLRHGSVTAYRLDDEPFRGMGVLTNSLPAEGTFWFDLTPGRYVVIARQRQEPDAIGPLKKGDLFCYTPTNPIEVNPAHACQVDLRCYPRDDLDHFLSQDVLDPRGKRLAARKDSSLEKASIQETGRGGAIDGPIAIIAGRVINLDGQPMPGLVVSAYPADALPLFQMYVLRFKADSIAKTDDKGFYRLEMRPGSYYLVAREKVGDAPNEGEHYGLYEGSANHSLSVQGGETKTGVQIVVESIMP